MGKKIKAGICAAIFLGALLGFGISTIKLMDISTMYRKSDLQYRQLRESIDIQAPQEMIENKLKGINNDFLAWIQIKGTPINYPVVMESEKDYLTTGFDGGKDVAGTPFVRRAQNAFADQNTVIFGHNMKNGTMFAFLKKYLKEDYCEQYPIVTIWSQGIVRNYRVFSVQLLDEDDSSVYSYMFTNDESYKEYLNLMVQHSAVNLAVRPDIHEKIVTLSTCYGSDKRLIVQAFEEE